MKKLILLFRISVCTTLLVLIAKNLSLAQTPKHPANAAFEHKESTDRASAIDAAPVQRRTDAHTINLTMDLGPAIPIGTPKLGGSGLPPGTDSANGLPPAVNGGSFEAKPAHSEKSRVIPPASVH